MKKIGIFGSAFNPLHLGHLNLLIQVQEHFGFDKIKVIPCFKSPFADDLNQTGLEFPVTEATFTSYKGTSKLENSNKTSIEPKTALEKKIDYH